MSRVLLLERMGRKVGGVLRWEGGVCMRREGGVMRRVVCRSGSSIPSLLDHGSNCYLQNNSELFRALNLVKTCYCRAQR